jgi:hypothetical protein
VVDSLATVLEFWSLFAIATSGNIISQIKWLPT